MSQRNIIPAVMQESWMYKEVNEKILVKCEIYTSFDYARKKMGEIRRVLKKKKISIHTFAEYYGIDVFLFYGLK